VANLKITLPIRGEQLTLIPGETLDSRAGQAIVTRTEPIGTEQIIWADYGSGIPQPHDPYEGCFIYGYTPSNKPVCGVYDGRTASGLLRLKCTTDGKKFCQRSIRPETAKLSRLETLSPEQDQQSAPGRNRRHSPKGKASGWIEERLGNLNRKTPSTSYYYCWQAGEQRGKCYVPIRKVAQVQQMLRDRHSVNEIITFLNKAPNTGIHHTFTPKL